MDFSKLTRDVAGINKLMKVLPDKSVVALDEFQIVFPSKYIDKQLAFIEGRDKYVVGIFAVVSGNKYAMLAAPNLVHVDPDDIERVVYDETEYVVMTVNRGSPLMVTKEVVVQDTLLYYIYDTYVDGGLDVWFMDYQNRLKLFDNTDKYANFPLGANRQVMRLLIAKTCRDPKNRHELFRTLLDTQAKANGLTPAVVPFKSVIYGPRTGSARLGGAYFDIAAQTGLVNPATKTDNIEKILRL